MSARSVSALVACLAAAAVAALVAGDGDQPRRARLELPTTGGLREGSDVRIAGATVGKVSALELGPGDVVVAHLELDRDDGAIGRDARAAIKANNLLGEKYVQLRRGGTPVPADQEVRIPASRTSFPVDLDEVLAVLDAPTRTKLAILINETGLALTGRRADFNEMLRLAPRSFDRATALLQALNADNASLGRLVDRTDRVLARLVPARRDLGRFVTTAAATMETAAARRRELRATVERAPAALRSARGLLGDLRRAAEPLGSAARLATSTAPPLADLLRQIEPFADSASPALRKAVATAPLLSRLGTDAAPVAREAAAPLRDVRAIAEAAPPLTSALEDGIDGALAALQGWARAIQGRDSIGHVFRGHLGFGPEAVRVLMRRLAPEPKRRAGRRRPSAPKRTAPVLRKRPVPDRRAPSRPRLPDVTKAVPEILEKPGEALRELLEDVPRVLPGTRQLPELLPTPGRPRNDPSTEPLLDFLLGR